MTALTRDHIDIIGNAALVAFLLFLTGLMIWVVFTYWHMLVVTGLWVITLIITGVIVIITCLFIAFLFERIRGLYPR